MPKLNMLDTYYMAGMVQEIVPKYNFFHTRYFPTNGNTDIFAANKVLVEFRDGDRKMAPFVVPRAGSIPIGRRGYEIHEFEPPLIAPSRTLTNDELKKRGFGEAIYTQTTPEERARAILLQDLEDLDNRIARREEWIAAQTMINNGYSAVAYIDDEETGEPFDIYFYDTAGSNPALYTVATAWDDTTGDFFSDVKAMCKLLSKRGLPAADLVLGTDAADVICDIKKVRDLLDNRRMEYGSLAPKIAYPGVAFLGALNFGGFLLSIFDVDESYEDKSGVIQSYFPAKSAMVTAPGCGHMMYGAVTQMEPDEQFHTFAMSRVPKYDADRLHNISQLAMSSRPLAAPLNKAPWIYAANVVK